MLECNFFDEIQLVVFDLDGTIYLGNELVYKADELVKKLRVLNKRVCFVTNNSAKTRKQILEKLISFGIDAEIKEILNSCYVIAKYLAEKNYTECYCIGTEFLKEEIEKFGIKTDSHMPSAIVAGYDKDFKLEDLNELCNMKLGNYELIVGNKERFYPSSGGKILPGAGPVVAAVEQVLNHKTDTLLGKPNTYMLKLMASEFGTNPKNICVIGDTYESDIVMAQNFGAKSILVSDRNFSQTESVKKLSDILEIL